MNDLNDEIKDEGSEERVSEETKEEIKIEEQNGEPEEAQSETTAENTEENAEDDPEKASDEETEETEETFEPERKPETTVVYTDAGIGQSGNALSYRTQKKEKKRNNSGAVIAILAAISALAIICACCALIVGMMISGRANQPLKPETTTEINNNHGNQKDPEDTDKPNDAPDTEKPAETDKTAPIAVTDPTFVINVGDSKNKYAMTDVAAMTVDSVVEIRTEQIVAGSFLQQYVAKGAGSGVIVTKDGYIVTNNHVIDGATSITVVLRNGKIYEAVLIGKDSVTDIAIVKIDETGLTPATFGSSEKLTVAESVIAIGNPLGSLGGSVTNGIISALARTVTIEDQEMTLMQTTAAINPGNSGGGLFNMSGECIGIVNAKSSGEDIEGIGFAIPSDTAVPIIEDLIKYGYVRGRVMLGVTMLEVNDSYTARRYGLSEFGVYIASVGSGSDAEKAGIKEKDKIVSINGKEISAYSEVKKTIQKFHAGEEAEIVVKRNGETLTLKIVFTEYVPSK
ncbi:MAG: trypsin-like peptidase domain-containing protein [Clostridia bacterium]|nr:trypsin-like peptidase domain-containing protein [Clostridia bacterium]